MGPPLITSLYAAPLGLMALALTVHVIMLRAKTGISIMDGGNNQLAERIRRHGNFIESVPLILLLMTLAELNGAGNMWLHITGVMLVVGRLLHAFGLKHDNPSTFGRIAGELLTMLAALVVICNILLIAFAK